MVIDHGNVKIEKLELEFSDEDALVDRVVRTAHDSSTVGSRWSGGHPGCYLFI